VVVLLVPLLARFDPLAVSGPPLGPPSSRDWFGTDELGRDAFSRVLWASRVSLPLAVVLVTGLVFIGGALGGCAGYFGGIADGAIMRFTDLVFSFPVILLAMTVTAALGPGLKNTVLAIMLIAWPSYARLIRALVTSARSAEYVAAGRLFGASSPRSLLIDIVPNIAGPVVVLATVDLGRAVLLLASLSFIGLGAQPPAPEWGSMLAAAVQFPTSWWLSVFPGLAIFSTVVGFALLGDSLRDALDPKSSWAGGRK
jgi:peptide/nickel transport system permease protein